MAQKNLSGLSMPREAPLLRRMMSAGIIVMKMPMKSLATSAMGPQPNSLCLRQFLGVVTSDRMMAAPMRPISTKKLRPRLMPSMSGMYSVWLMSESVPFRMTAAMIMTMYRKLMPPSMWSFSAFWPSGSRSAGERPSAVSFFTKWRSMRAKTTHRTTVFTTSSGQMCWSVQKKGTPRR